MPGTFEILLLLAFPASGKSELRRYLDALEPARRAGDLHVASPVHLDDYPYVHLMRRISQHRLEEGDDPLFFASDDTPFLDDRDWGTLVELLAEDWSALSAAPPQPPEPASWLLDRLDRARRRAGLPAPFAAMVPGPRQRLEAAVAQEAMELTAALGRGRPIAGGPRTVVLEFARGGPEGAAPPFPEPLGYRYSLSLLPRPLLQRAAVLYVWVTPEQSRLRNRERSRPGGEATILHHGVPDTVMRADYGTDDMTWLLRTSRRPGTIAIPAAGGCIDVPAVAFDNRDDSTSFLRDDRDRWNPEDLDRLHGRLAEAMSRLWAARSASP